MHTWLSSEGHRIGSSSCMIHSDLLRRWVWVVQRCVYEMFTNTSLTICFALLCTNNKDMGWIYERLSRSSLGHAHLSSVDGCKYLKCHSPFSSSHSLRSLLIYLLPPVEHHCQPSSRLTFYNNACAQKQQIALMEREFGPVVVGEWSLATDNCAMWLNGFNGKQFTVHTTRAVELSQSVSDH